MPIVVTPPPGDAADGRLPAHLVRTLVWHRATNGYDPADGAPDTSWVTTTLQGRIARPATQETGDAGRQSSSARVRLLTNTPGIGTADRVTDPLTADVWEVDGDPQPVFGADGLHHYEAPLRKVEG
jgi:hypothetical protein